MTVSIWKSTARFKNKASIIRFVSFVNFVDKNIALPASRTTRYMAGQLTTFLTCGQVLVVCLNQGVSPVLLGGWRLKRVSHCWVVRY